MKLYVIILLFSLYQLGCETTPGEVHSHDLKANHKASLKKEPQVGNPCNLTEGACDMQYSPTYCEFPEYITPFGKFLTRGSNPCDARKKLFRNLCEANVQVVETELIHCAPDPTVTECWDLEFSDCPDKKQEPYTCFASNYNNRKLPTPLTIRSYGLNECEASNRLLLESCNRFLKPSGIKDFECEPTELYNTCPPPPIKCVLSDDKKTCTLNLNEKLTLTTLGRGECAARHKMKMKLCRLGMNPAKVEAIRCR